MKRTVRKGFETNSSSMHSIVITKAKGNSSTESIWSDSKLHIWNAYYERSPFEVLSTFRDKVSYAIASYAHDEGKLEEIIDIVNEKGYELELPTRIERSYFREDNGKAVLPYDCEWKDDSDDAPLVLKENHNVEVLIKEEEVVDGYVDHQSSGLLQSFLNKHNISLSDFLNEAKYIVIVDGDEYDSWGEMGRLHLINTDMIEEQFPHNETFDEYRWREENKNEENN